MTSEGDGPARRGSDTSLVALYDAVPAAEVLDLREEWKDDQAQQFRDAWSSDGHGEWGEELVDDSVDPLTDGQVFGLIEHLLGAERVTDADGDSDEQAGG